MNPKWLKLAADMLELAGEELATYESSSWKWPEDWTTEDRRGFAEALARWNGDYNSEQVEREVASHYGPDDHVVMTFLGSRFEEMAKEGSR
jgi:hypothetical protein